MRHEDCDLHSIYINFSQGGEGEELTDDSLQNVLLSTLNTDKSTCQKENQTKHTYWKALISLITPVELTILENGIGHFKK